MTTKYIVFEDVNAPLAPPIAIVFPEQLRHYEMAHLVTIAGRRSVVIGPAPLYVAKGAGFYSDRGRTYGRSESLNLDSRPEDAEVVQRLLEGV